MSKNLQPTKYFYTLYCMDLANLYYLSSEDFQFVHSLSLK